MMSAVCIESNDDYSNMNHENFSHFDHETAVDDIHSTFPVRLHMMLEKADSEGFDSIVSWLPGGMTFKVHDREIFIKSIVPSYFTLTKYQSFRRQLRLYGFKRITEGPTKGAYFHPQFIRNKRHLCFNMIRQVKKKAPALSIRDIICGPNSDDSLSSLFGKQQVRETLLNLDSIRDDILGPSESLTIQELDTDLLAEDIPTSNRIFNVLEDNIKPLDNREWLEEHNQMLWKHIFDLTKDIQHSKLTNTSNEVATTQNQEVIDEIISIFGTESNKQKRLELMPMQ